MSGLRSIVSPRFMTALGGFFPDTVTIETATETRDEYGAVTQTWAPVAELTDLAANVGPVDMREVRTATSVYAEATHQITLASAHDDITTRRRAVDDQGRVFDILGVETDTFDTYTRLAVRLVTL